MMKDFIKNLNEWLKYLIDLGIALVAILVIIDILFPGTTGIFNNISKIVEAFSTQGVAGLIALFLFLLIYFKGK